MTTITPTTPTYFPGLNTGNPGVIPQPIAQTFDHRKYIHLFAEGFNQPTLNVGLNILAGDDGPSITDGYAQWSLVNRPLRVGLMVYTGRNPPVMQIPVRFILFAQDGTWLQDQQAGITIEEQIHTLEWMAGEGVASGPSMLVWPTTYDNAGNTTPLVPWWYQADTPNALQYSGGDRTPWVITALQWGTAIRNQSMQRIRQDATITLTYYISDTAPKPRTPRAKATVVTAAPGLDSALLIARSVPSNDVPLLAQVIIEEPRNQKLGLRSINQKIKHGRRVYVPASTQL